MRQLEHRRARVQRLLAKRPATTVRATYRPRKGTLERLADLVIELLDEQRQSGGGSGP